MAELVYVQLYGPNPPAAALPFLQDVMTSGRGWLLIVLGGLIGFCFATLALSITVISFPLMLDRDIGLVPAVVASMQLARQNPGTIALWGLIVAAALVIGSLPLFVGLALVMPVLGHATWRLYRRAVERDPAHEVPIYYAPAAILRRPPPSSGARAPMMQSDASPEESDEEVDEIAEQELRRNYNCLGCGR